MAEHKVKVLASDAEGAEPGRPDRCLVAQALEREFGREAWVGIFTALIGGKPVYLDDAGTKLIFDFDAGKEITYPVLITVIEP